MEVTYRKINLTIISNGISVGEGAEKKMWWKSS